MATILSEFEKAKREGFIGTEDIYIRQLTRRHVVVIELVNDSWVSYRVHWREDGELKKTVELTNGGSFDNALGEAVKYIRWFQAKRWDVN